MLFHEYVFSQSSYLSTLSVQALNFYILHAFASRWSNLPGLQQRQYSTEALTCYLRNFRSILHGMDKHLINHAHVVSFPIPVPLPDRPFTAPVLNKSPRQAHIAPCAVRGAEPLPVPQFRRTTLKRATKATKAMKSKGNLVKGSQIKSGHCHFLQVLPGLQSPSHRNMLQAPSVSQILL